MTAANTAQAQKYFNSLEHALRGLDTFLREDESPAYKHDVIAAIVNGYIKRLQDSLDSWESKVTFEPKFRVSQTESGFPAFENVLEVQNDLKGAQERLEAFEDLDTLKQAMVDHILSQKSFPAAIQKKIAERHYLELLLSGNHFAPLVLPKTIRVSVNPKTNRPYYVTHWGYYDGSTNLPIIYMATIEDSSPDIVKLLVSPTGFLTPSLHCSLMTFAKRTQPTASPFQPLRRTWTRILITCIQNSFAGLFWGRFIIAISHATEKRLIRYRPVSARTKMRG